MSLTDHLREAMERHGITARDLAPWLDVAPDAVYQQLTRPQPRRSTVRRYAEALTAVLHGRGDWRVFTAESLQIGWEPLTEEQAVSTAVDLAAAKRTLRGQPDLSSRSDSVSSDVLDALGVIAATLAAQPDAGRRAQLAAPELGRGPVAVPFAGTLPGQGPAEPQQVLWLDPGMAPRVAGADLTVYLVVDAHAAGHGVAAGDLLVVCPSEPLLEPRLIVAQCGEHRVCRRWQRCGDQQLLLPGSDEEEPELLPTEALCPCLGVVLWVLPRGFDPSAR